jgi:hypothetical protein
MKEETAPEVQPGTARLHQTMPRGAWRPRQGWPRRVTKRHENRQEWPLSGAIQFNHGWTRMNTDGECLPSVIIRVIRGQKTRVSRKGRKGREGRRGKRPETGNLRPEGETYRTWRPWRTWREADRDCPSWFTHRWQERPPSVIIRVIRGQKTRASREGRKGREGRRGKRPESGNLRPEGETYRTWRPWRTWREADRDCPSRFNHGWTRMNTDGGTASIRADPWNPWSKCRASL